MYFPIKKEPAFLKATVRGKTELRKEKAKPMAWNFCSKEKGKFNGWIGYTLSWNYRQFDEINSGNKYRFRYDRRHDFEIVANYQISKAWAVSGSWQYATGNAITLPLLKYQTFDPFNFYPFEIEIQGEKMPIPCHPIIDWMSV